MSSDVLLFDPALPETRVEFGMARAEFAGMQAARAAAEQWSACADVLREARAYPEVYTGPSRDVEFAVRAAAADLAVRLGVTEPVVRDQAARADVLIRRMPLLWAWFREGEIAASHMWVVADVITGMPDEVLSRLEAEVLERRALPLPRFRTQVRLLAARLHPQELATRHEIAASKRAVWVESESDGMALLIARMPEADATRALAHIDHLARQAVTHPDETRTLAQIRADLVRDLVAGDLKAGTGVGVTVGVLIPVETLLGVAERPATLDGVIPIDPNTARNLAGESSFWRRLLTDPVSGTILDYDRRSYRPPADLDRLIRTTHPVCDFPGCNRPSRTCDLDHTTAWQHGGTTTATNLRPLCRGHHRLKHHTRWTTDGTHWTSPTGHTTPSANATDPPPF
ncbi:HNH endonuclease signature motif containing protein [Schumannella luteola]